MYENNVIEKQAAYGVMLGSDCIDRNPTVEENLDNRIAGLKAELARLEESKKTLGPLLPMRIRDIRIAMNF